MKICNVANEASGEKSELHAKLLEIFKNQKEADLYYSKVLGDDFKKVFGDWVGAYKGTSSEKTGETYDTGEPKLFRKKESNDWFFREKDGTIFPIKHLTPLRRGFSPQDIKDISKFFLINFVNAGGAKSFNQMDAEKNQSKILKSIENSIESYREDISEILEDPDDIAEYTEKINKVESYKNAWKDELVYQLDSLGQKFKEKITDSEGNLEGEVKEEDKGGGINVKESITQNSKDTATVNTKILLSQLVSQEINEDGELEDVYSGYLSTPVFEDFSKVWETLQPMLSDIVTSEVDGEVVSTYKQMKKVIDSLHDIKPWSRDLSAKLEGLYNDNKGGRYKVFEFVQAFNKTKINYYVTEFNEANSGYTIYNATSANSRETQILDRWGFRFQERWLGGDQIYLTNEKRDEIDAIYSDVIGIREEWSRKLSDASKLNYKIQNYKGDENSKEFEDMFEKHQEMVNESYSYVAESLFPKLRELGMFGLEESDINEMILLGGGNENQFNTIDELFKGVLFMISKNITMVDEKGKGIKFTDDEGKSVNPMKSQKLVKLLAKASALRELDIAESSILGPGGKTFFAYANPTYVSNKIAEWKKDPSKLDKLASETINKNSKWLYYIRAAHIKNNEELRIKESIKRIDAIEIGLASSFTSVGRDNAVDNTKISLGDQLNDNISKLLGSRLENGYSLFPTIIAADKSRRMEFKGFDFFESGINNRSGELVIPPKTVDLFVSYFEDEYNRMKDVRDDLKTMKDSDKIKHYHTGKMNGKKSQLFPEFSYDIESELKDVLYDKDGFPFESAGVPGFTNSQREAVFNAVKKSLRSRYDETFDKVNKLSETSKLNQKLVKYYNKQKMGMAGLVGDYLVNGLMSSIEYTKMFSGDPAFYKDLPDLIKRVPSTYTDGLQLSLESSDDMVFNTAIVQGVEVASQYQKIIYDSLKDKSIAKAYGKFKDGTGSDVNTTDAQAWITPRRWKFLKKRLGQWSPQHDIVFNKMITGKRLDQSKGELKLAAQPLKGVYFEINRGVPTYLKYSQAVLIPSMVKGTPMEKLLYKMTHDKDGNELSRSEETHEVITEDGIKVGAIAPSKINKGNTTELAEEFELNPHTLSNTGWKLQQDLPIKSMHETNIGSQIQKNILEGLRINDEDTYKIFGESKEKSGEEVLKMVHDAVSDLINIGAEELKERLNLDKNDKISDKSPLYDILIDEFKSRGGNENIVSALQKETPIDSMPQIRGGRVDSILMSIFNKAMTKISTEGGSFIQVSPFGFEKFDDKSGIVKISDRYNGEGLLPPREGEDGQTLPGQVLMPHTLAIKLLENSGEKMVNMTNAKWKKLFEDPKTREIVGYRIPNQGMSSNDTLEIVGILPETMGDSIIGYDGIPAKTGSDFDIDKMYVMAPNLLFNKKDNKFELINKENSDSYNGNKNLKKLIAQNRLLNLYSDILQSDHTYDNMMTSIDSGYLKEDIDKIHGVVNQKNLDLFSPVTQLEIKENYMSGKTGVGLTANQLVDHVANQSLDISINDYIGMGNFSGKEDGRRSLMDLSLSDQEKKEGKKSIADKLSAFLNAYVDIAKDPYVTRGNHNDKTANVTFMLIRAGASLETINRYIGQPILKELVELKKQSESITSDPLVIKGTRVTPYEFLRDKYNIKKYDKSHLQLSKISDKQFESRINGNKNDFIDSVVLNAFEYHEKKAAKWTEGVLAAKTDTKGAGGSPVSMNVYINKINKVLSDNFIGGYESKFDGTAAGTYMDMALMFTKKVLNSSGILISATEGASDLFNRASSELTNSEYLISEKLGKSIDKGMYSYLMSGTDIMKDNREDFKYLFEKLPLKLAKMKENSDNFLIQQLEINKVGFYNFIGINSKNKPMLYENDIYRGWLDLYENEETKDLAVDLARYSYSQSGFSPNLNQFFTHIPQEILKDSGINMKVNSFFQKIEDMATDDVFMDQFYRHESNNIDVVPRVSSNQILQLDETNKIHAFSVNTIFEEKFIRKNISGERYLKPPLFTSVQLEGEIGLYELYNKEDFGPADIYGEGMSQKPVYVRTYKLGYKAGKNKVFEYSYDNEVKNSILPQNQFSQDFIKEIRKSEDIYSEEYFRYKDLEYDLSSQENFQIAENEANASGTIDELDGPEEKGFYLSETILKKLGVTKKGCE